MAAAGALLAALCLAATPRALAAQGIHGSVVDAVNGRPIPLAGVYLTDAERNTVSVAMADSVGRYFLPVPESGEYILFAERFGYFDTESPLFAISADRDYPLDLELRARPIGLDPIEVTVRNETVIDWLTLELGANPMSAFGFRIMQGARVEEAKVRGRNDPTKTLRWLYVPIWHGGRCVRINDVPRARGQTWRGPRGGTGGVGEAPQGTRPPSARDAASTADAGCGSLYVDDRRHPNDLIDDVPMDQVAVVVTLPGQVRLYTYRFTADMRGR